MIVYHTIFHLSWRTTWILGSSILVLAGWFGGLMWFIDVISTFERQHERLHKEPQIEAIVVVTGSDSRVRTGLDLLAKRYANHLLISGVHAQVTLNTLLDIVGSEYHHLSCCIDLGYQAKDTAGNAVETSRWLERYHYTSFYLVTDSYHMPRTISEFEQIMSDIRIIPYPVITHGRLIDVWWYPSIFIVISTEYNKFLITCLSQWFMQIMTR